MPETFLPDMKKSNDKQGEDRMGKKRFGKILHQRRKENHLTRHELAEKMSVTDRTVSRWENGDSYPDTAFLPKLARIFGVSLDRLFSAEPEPCEEEIAPLEEKCAAALEEQEFPGALEFCEGILKKDPDNLLLKLRIGSMLPWYASRVDDETISENALKKADALFREAARSVYPQIRNSALYMLAINSMHRNHPEEAEKLLKSIPKEEARPEHLLPAAYMMQNKLDQAEQLQQRNLFCSISDASSALLSLASIAQRQKRFEDALRLAQAQENLIEIFGLQDFMGINSNELLAEIYAQMQQKEKALLYLEKYLESARAFWDRKELADNWFFSSLPREKSTVTANFTKQQLIDSVEQNPRYAFIREFPEFRTLLDRYRETAPEAETKPEAETAPEAETP